MDRDALLAEFESQLEQFEKFQTFIEKAQNYSDKFNPAVVEKVISDNTEKCAEIAAQLDPLVGDLRALISQAEQERESVKQGVSDAKMNAEELSLRLAIGELSQEEHDELSGDLRERIEAADSRIAEIDAGTAALQAVFDRWSALRPEATAADDDLLSDVEPAPAADDLLGEDAGFDGPAADAGVHSQAASMADDVSAVFQEGAAPPAADDADDEVIELDPAPVASAPEGKAVLTMAPDTPDHKSFEFNNDALSIGRNRDNDIQVKNDSKVSRHHCKLTHEDGAYFLEDNKSANGTLVNGEFVTKRRLYGGEQIVVGETQFRFEFQNA